MVISLRILIMTKFSKALINLKIIQCQNKNNNKNQMKSLSRELCGYYCLDLYKSKNSSRTSHSSFSRVNPIIFH